MKDFFTRYASLQRELMEEVRKNPFCIQNRQEIQSFGLEFQVHEILTRYFSATIEDNTDLSFYLTLWICEAFLKNLDYAQKNTLAYKETLSFSREYVQKQQNILSEFRAKYALKCQEKQSAEKKDNFSSKIKVDSRSLLLQEIQVFRRQLTENIPCTLSETLSENSENFLAVRHDDVEGITSIESSGTSQSFQNNKEKKTQFKRIYSSATDLESTQAFFFYGMQNILDSTEDRVALLMSGDRAGSVGHLLKNAMDLLGVPCIVLGFPTDIEQTVQALYSFQPTCLIGVPAHVLALSHSLKLFSKQEQKNPLSIKNVLLSGDCVTEHIRKQISQNFDCTVFAHYGLTETGLGGAVECLNGVHRHQNGSGKLHIRQLDIYVEILDEQQRNVADGEFGEIVITTLTREAMPLIRYRTGDMGRLIDASCACKSVLTRLEVCGRMQQMLKFAVVGYVHISVLQDFLYQYTEIMDCDICVLWDDEEINCLMIGVKVSKKIQEYELISTIAHNFSEKLLIPTLCLQENANIISYKKGNGSHIHEKMQNALDSCIFCSHEQYQSILEQNKYLYEDKELNKKRVPQSRTKKTLSHIHMNLRDFLQKETETANPLHNSSYKDL